MTDIPEAANDQSIPPHETIEDEERRLTMAFCGFYASQTKTDAVTQLMQTMAFLPAIADGFNGSKEDVLHSLRYGCGAFDQPVVPGLLKHAWDALHAMDESGVSVDFPQLTSWMREILPPESALIPTYGPRALIDRIRPNGHLHELHRQLEAACGYREMKPHTTIPAPELFALCEMIDTLQCRIAITPPDPYFILDPKFAATIPKSFDNEYVRRRGEEQKTLNAVKSIPAHNSKYGALIQLVEEYLRHVNPQEGAALLPRR